MRGLHVSCMTNRVQSCSLPPGASLVQTLIQLGPEITSDADTVRALLPRFGISDANPPRDTHVVEIISSLARLAAEGTTLCDVGALVRALGSFVSSNFSTVASIVVDTFCSMSTLTGPASSRHSTGRIDMGSIRPR